MRTTTGASASWCDLTRVVRAIATVRCDYACHDGRQLVRSDPSCPSHWHGEVRLCEQWSLRFQSWHEVCARSR